MTCVIPDCIHPSIFAPWQWGVIPGKLPQYLSSYEIKMHQQDYEKCCLVSEQKRKANLFIFIYRSAEGGCKT